MWGEVSPENLLNFLEEGNGWKLKIEKKIITGKGRSTREMRESRKGCSLQGEVLQTPGIPNTRCKETAQEADLLIWLL